MLSARPSPVVRVCGDELVEDCGQGRSQGSCATLTWCVVCEGGMRNTRCPGWQAVVVAPGFPCAMTHTVTERASGVAQHGKEKWVKPHIMSWVERSNANRIRKSVLPHSVCVFGSCGVWYLR